MITIYEEKESWNRSQNFITFCYNTSFSGSHKSSNTNAVFILIANESVDDLDGKDSEDELHISKTEEKIIEERSEEKELIWGKGKKIEESKRTIKFNLQFDHEWAIPAEFQSGEKKSQLKLCPLL